MPTEYLHPGVYLEEVATGMHPIPGVPTSTALFVGWAPRGPIDAAVRITGFAEFQRVFGGLDKRSRLGYAVSHFFGNGGSEAWVIRLVAANARAAKCLVGGMTIAARSPGDWANSLSIVTAGSPDDPARFRLDVTDADDIVLESFQDLSMEPHDRRYAPALIAGGSHLIRVAATAAAASPADGKVPLNAVQAGAVGTVLAPEDSGGPGIRFRAALSRLFEAGGRADRIDLFNLICVPGLTDPATVSKLQDCARDRRAFLLVDCAETASVAELADAPVDGGGNAASHAALYFPWVKAPDPLQNGAVRPFPPCGFVAGLYARTDSSRGVWKAPAGVDASIIGAAGLAVALTDAQNGRLSPRGVNCLRSFPLNGTVAWGARTMAGDDGLGSEWKYVPVRRTALFIEESLYRGTQWAVFEPNDEPLWAKLRLNVGAFMQILFRQGAFQGRTPREAWFVKCDRETTTQSDINNGVVNIVVGFAPLKPAEFVILRLQLIAGQTAV